MLKEYGKYLLQDDIFIQVKITKAKLHKEVKEPPFDTRKQQGKRRL